MVWIVRRVSLNRLLNRGLTFQMPSRFGALPLRKPERFSQIPDDLNSVVHSSTLRNGSSQALIESHQWHIAASFPCQVDGRRHSRIHFNEQIGRASCRERVWM